MVNRSEERVEFLQDMYDCARSGARYWLADHESENGDLNNTEGVDAIVRGLNAVQNGKADYANPGYDGSTRSRISLVNRTNANDGDYDAWDADAILQIGLFGSVQYS